ncbi:hypothetical protein BST61_g4991 [Cercospora zeina]
MSGTVNFVQANSDYDEEQIRHSTRLAQRQATENPGFVFVNFDFGHDEDQKRTSRKLIRSKATAYSHRVAPRGGMKSEVSLPLLRSASEGESSTTTSTLASSESSGTHRAVKRARGNSDASDVDDGGVQANMRRKRATLPFDLSLPDLASMDASMRDPFLTYPVRYRSWYGKLIGYWYNVVLPRSTRVIKASPTELQSYTIWSRKQELSEPVLFYTSLFLASGIPVAEGLFPVQAALWLRHKTVQAMQEALADPDRATSIPVILAVGRIALHEHIYGSRELAHTMHRPAQLRMINMRGGLANLGLPATTIQLIVWLDALMSAETGTTPYFADVPKKVGIQSYTPQEAIHVTNFSSPHRTAHPGYDDKKASTTFLRPIVVLIKLSTTILTKTSATPPITQSPNVQAAASTMSPPRTRNNGKIQTPNGIKNKQANSKSASTHLRHKRSDPSKFERTKGSDRTTAGEQDAMASIVCTETAGSSSGEEEGNEQSTEKGKISKGRQGSPLWQEGRVSDERHTSSGQAARVFGIGCGGGARVERDNEVKSKDEVKGSEDVERQEMPGRERRNARSLTVEMTSMGARRRRK